jgi:tetratricopeptide (TPR) repeat protein
VIALFISLGGLLAAAHDHSPAAQLLAAVHAQIEKAFPIRESEKEFLKLLAQDDAAQREADRWIREADALESQGIEVNRSALVARIQGRFAPIRKSYEDYIRRHPEHVQARLAYGSFLNDIGEELEAVQHFEKAREMDPSNPAAWNNLANYYGHRGPVIKAFEYYEKAMELNPQEPVYIQNLATSVYLFRKDAREYYHLTEEEVFNRALGLYRKALKIDPDNFLLAADYAQSYYGIRPMRTEEALAAWNYALKVADDESDRQGVYTHLARIHIMAGQFDEAQDYLSKVNLPRYDVLQNRLSRNLEKGRADAEKEKKELPDQE